MEIFKRKNIEVKGKHDKPILTDVIFRENNKLKPVVIFCHGYKGFKDWGAWEKMAEQFAGEDFFFVKFNFSHNGTTPQDPTNFMDIMAFGENNYSKELDDLQQLIDWLLHPDFEYGQHLDPSNINLIGHSRGGGIAAIKASEELRITKLITFSSVSDFGNRFPGEKEIDKWKEKGVSYITNARTGQQLPHHFQFYTNFKENEERLTISRAVKELKIPHLIVHGSNDTSVPISDSGELFEWSPFPDLLLVESADHVYGTCHPWEEDKLPIEFQYVLDHTLKFLKEDKEALLKKTASTDSSNF
ncbi:alpha/beta hydrolase [Antarcticibacterium arcticum]|uniref:Alpha/beta hydrolase n=2 Tax=Antarcticibacterium arcticum TaxID=2585771 RepID=A0A5B8YNQ1_9FLAO|nr:alpha/beta fold hydrolase [Antarcticibacterium arcticum]QED39121.1 alpha/beta hydrolase [Antarcticibacterium arcticum]